MHSTCTKIKRLLNQIPSVFLPNFLQLQSCSFCKSVLKEDTILCELYADTGSDVSDNSDNETFGSDSDIPNSSHKQLRPSAIVVTSDSERSTEEEESCKPESSDDKKSDMWCKTDKNEAVSLSLEPQV